MPDLVQSMVRDLKMDVHQPMAKERKEDRPQNGKADLKRLVFVILFDLSMSLAGQ